MAPGKGHAHFRERRRHAITLGDGLIHPRLDDVRVTQALERGHLRQLVGVEGLAHRVERPHPGLRSHSVAHAQTAQAVGLAEGAGDQQVRTGAREYRHPTAVGLGDEVVVGLVHQHRQVVRDEVEEPLDLIRRPVHARRVVRIADDHQARALIHRGRHGVEVVPSIRGKRHGDALGPRFGGEVRVHGEGRVGVDDRGARVEQRGARVHDELA